MKTNITSLVEEALKEMKRPVHIQYHQENLKKILTSLAIKASQNGLQPLPEEAPEWFMIGYTEVSRKDHWNGIVQHFGTKPPEWWMGLKKGDKFIDVNGDVKMFTGTIFIETGAGLICDVSKCSPYTEPSKSFRDKLSPELQQEFDKEIAPLIKTK